MGVLPSPGNGGPDPNCTEDRESLSVDMHGLCAKPRCSVVHPGEAYGGSILKCLIIQRRPFGERAVNFPSSDPF